MIHALGQGVRSLDFYDELVRKLNKNNGVIHITGTPESQKANFAAGVLPEGRSALVVCPNELKAREFYEDMKLYDADAFLYPARDMIFYHADVSGNLIERQRLEVIRALTEKDSVTVVTCVRGCLDRLCPLEVFTENVTELEVGGEFDLTEFEKKLS